MTQYRVTVDGHPYDVEVEDPTARPVVARIGDETFSVAVGSGNDREQSTPQTAPQGAPSERRAATSPVAAVHASSDSTLTAPIPGVVANIAVSPGQTVTRGDELLTLEAMKMMNVIRAPSDGAIETVHVTQGSQVTHGEVLVTFATN